MSLLVSLLIRTLILLDMGPTPMASFSLDYFLRGPASKSRTFEVRTFPYAIRV